MTTVKASKYTTRRLVFTAVVVVAIAAVQPYAWNQVNQSAEALHQSRSAAQQAVAIEQRIEEMKQHQVEHQVLVDQLALGFPTAGSTSRIVERLEELSSRSAVALEILNIQEQAGSARSADVPVTSLEVTLVVSGAADNLLSYLDSLERALEVSHINSVTLEEIARPDTGDPNSPSHQLLIKTTFFFQAL